MLLRARLTFLLCLTLAGTCLADGEKSKSSPGWLVKTCPYLIAGVIGLYGISTALIPPFNHPAVLNRLDQTVELVSPARATGYDNVPTLVSVLRHPDPQLPVRVTGDAITLPLSGKKISRKSLVRFADRSVAEIAATLKGEGVGLGVGGNERYMNEMRVILFFEYARHLLQEAQSESKITVQGQEVDARDYAKRWTDERFIGPNALRGGEGGMTAVRSFYFQLLERYLEARADFDTIACLHHLAPELNLAPHAMSILNPVINDHADSLQNVERLFGESEFIRRLEQDRGLSRSLRHELENFNLLRTRTSHLAKLGSLLSFDANAQ